jgi:hypothetical protein
MMAKLLNQFLRANRADIDAYRTQPFIASDSCLAHGQTFTAPFYLHPSHKILSIITCFSKQKMKLDNFKRILV